MSDKVLPEAARGWNDRYAEGSTGWDLGEAPPVVRRVSQDVVEARRSQDSATPPRVLVPGCGRGHDAIGWAQAGATATGLDFAPLALEAARRLSERAGLPVSWVLGDVFDLPDALAGTFDVVWEQTCFCAIDPGQRRAYAESMTRALAPGGVLLGLFWRHGREGGPPFNVTPEDVQTAFEGLMTLESVEEVPDSVPSRQPEFLARLRRA